MVRRCWVNFQCRGVLLVLIVVGQGPIALPVGAVGVVLTFFLSSICSLLFLHFFGRRPDRLKYCLKGPLNPKQPTNQPSASGKLVGWLFRVKRPFETVFQSISGKFLWLVVSGLTAL